ncbi:MAG TPA: pilus assembly protein PilM [Chthonomonadales bacterium]|nr:pilus assembly protein PilM [Chthonomonadales bacterium]
MRHRAIIGVDISSDEIRAAYVRSTSGGPQLEGIASIPAPPNSIDREGLLVPEALGDAIRGLCLQIAPKASHVAIGINSGSLVARVMEIPPVPDSEIRAVVRGEMDHFRILPAGQSAFDFHRLPVPPEGPDKATEGPNTRVLLMGAEERVVASYRASVDAAGLNVVAVEPGAIAVLRAQRAELIDREAIATVVVSQSATDICVSCNGDLRFYRRVDTGTAEMVRRADGIGQQAAEAPSGLLVPAEDFRDYSQDQDAAEDGLNRAAMSALMTEVQRSIDYYVREFPTGEDQIDIHFAIDAPNAAAVFEAMRQYLRRPARLAALPEDLAAASASSGVPAAGVPRYLAAIGLALRCCGGPYGGAAKLDLSVGDRVIRERRAAPKAMVLSLAVSGLILVVTVGAAVVTGFRIAGTQRTLTQVKHELSSLRGEHAAAVAKKARQKQLVGAIEFRNKPILQTVEFVSAAVPPRAGLVSLEMDKDGSVTILGHAHTPRAVADLMDTLNMAPVLEPVRLNALSRQQSRDRGGPWFLRFDLQTAYVKRGGPELEEPKTAAATPTSPSGGG